MEEYSCKGKPIAAKKLSAYYARQMAAQVLAMLAKTMVRYVLPLS